MNYKEELLNDIMPFWLNNAIDFENGGLETWIDKTDVSKKPAK